jgi:hypothetical protein
MKTTVIGIETFDGNKLRLELVEEQVTEFNNLSENQRFNYLASHTGLVGFHQIERYWWE